MSCKMCQERIKDWNGDDPKCAFPDGVFTEKNWNCATANAIRNIAEPEWGVTAPNGVSHQRCDDQNYSTIRIVDLDIERGEDDRWPIALYVGWYKSRGRTETMLIMTDSEMPHLPTEENCLQIIAAYKEKTHAQ